MSKLVNSLVPEETYTITETVSTGKFYVTRVGSITKQPTPVFIAENITEISSWLRTHPEITEATVVSIWSKDLLEKQSTYTVGPNDSVVFSPDVNRPQYGGKVKNFLNTVLNRVFDARKFRTAVNTAYADVPEEDRPGFAITKNKSNTGKFGNEQGRVAELFAGTLDDARKAAIRNAVRDVFKQEEVGIKDAKTGQITFNTEVPDDAQEESTMENDDKITESMFLTGADNTLNGNAQLDYRNMLAGEIFGSAAFSTQRPHADTHEGANVVMDTQTVEGMGVLRPVGAPAANMNEDTSFNKRMLNMAKSLFRANRMDEAAKIVDAIDSPSTAAAKVLEAALATDGIVDEKLTEDLYNAAAYLNVLAEALYANETPADRGSENRKEIANIIRAARKEEDPESELRNSEESASKFASIYGRNAKAKTFPDFEQTMNDLEAEKAHYANAADIYGMRKW